MIINTFFTKISHWLHKKTQHIVYKNLIKSSALWYQYRAYKHLLRIQALAQHISELCNAFIETPEDPHDFCHKILTSNFLTTKKQKEDLIQQWKPLHPRELITALIKSIEHSLLQELQQLPRLSHFSAFRKELSQMRSLIHHIRRQLNQIKAILEIPPQKHCTINLEEHWKRVESGKETLVTFIEKLETVLLYFIHQTRDELKKEELFIGHLEVQSPPIYLHHNHTTVQQQLIQTLATDYLHKITTSAQAEIPNSPIVRKLPGITHLIHEATSLKNLLEDALANNAQHIALQILFNAANSLQEETIETQYRPLSRDNKESDSFLTATFHDLIEKSSLLANTIPETQASSENSYYYSAAYETHVNSLKHFIKDFPHRLKNIRDIHLHRSQINNVLSKMDVEALSSDEKYSLLYGIKKLIHDSHLLEPFLEIILKKTQSLEDSQNALVLFLSSKKFSYIQEDCHPDEALISRCEACLFACKNIRQHLNLIVDHFPDNKLSLYALLSSTLENIKKQIESFSLFLLDLYLHTGQMLLSPSVFRQMVMDIHFFPHARKELKEHLENASKDKIELCLLKNTFHGLEQLLSWFPEQRPKTHHLFLITTSWGYLVQDVRNTLMNASAEPQDETISG